MKIELILTAAGAAILLLNGAWAKGVQTTNTNQSVAETPAPEPSNSSEEGRCDDASPYILELLHCPLAPAPGGNNPGVTDQRTLTDKPHRETR